MEVSLIISVYKNTNDLEVILNALAHQTVMPTEIIISEDGESEEMKLFLKNHTAALRLVHLSQPDRGWQKNKALNNAVRAAKHDYVIFIDGDCVPHHKFIENHIKLAGPKKILVGKRIKLGLKFSDLLRKTPLLLFEKRLLSNTISLFKDKVAFFEEGVYISPGSVLGSLAKRKKIKWITGCNFSCYKDSLIDINGFDEDYVLPAIGEDIDLVWRFKGLGYTLESARYFAIQYHLYHKENWISQEENVAIMNEKQRKKNYRCLNGLVNLSSSSQHPITNFNGSYNGS